MTDFSEIVPIIRGPEGSNDTGQGRIVRVADNIALAGFSTDNYPISQTHLVAVKHIGPALGTVLEITRPETEALNLLAVLPWTGTSALVVVESGDFETYSFYVGRADVNTTTLEVTFTWLFDHPVTEAEEGCYASSWPEQDLLILAHNNGQVGNPDFDLSFVTIFDVSSGTVIEDLECPPGQDGATWPAYIYGSALNTQSEEILLFAEFWTGGSSRSTAWKKPIPDGVPGAWSSPSPLGASGSNTWARYGTVAPDGDGWRVSVTQNNDNGTINVYLLPNDLVWPVRSSSDARSFQQILNTYFGTLKKRYTDVEPDPFTGKTAIAAQVRFENRIAHVIAEGTTLTQELISTWTSEYWDVTQMACVGADKYVYLVGGYDVFPPNPTLPLYGWGVISAGTQDTDPGAPPEEEPNRQVGDDGTRRAFRPMKLGRR